MDQNREKRHDFGSPVPIGIRQFRNHLLPFVISTKKSERKGRVA
jgi:hypothetical protein